MHWLRTRQDIVWTACLAGGYAAFLAVAKVAVGVEDVAAGALDRAFWVRFWVAIATSLLLWPVFRQLARRPGFSEGYGRYLTAALLGLASLAMFAALLGSEHPAGLRLFASIVGAHAS